MTETSTNTTIQLAASLGLICFAALIWLGWRVHTWMPVQAARSIRRAVGLLGVVLLGVLVWFGWEFRPWMPAGRAVQLSSTEIGDYEFQVWQRKNKSIFEPFATGLFVRKQGDPWKAFLLDFEDTYRSPIALRREDSGVAVFSGSSKLGVFDGTQQVFKRDSKGSSFPVSSVLIGSDPPGNWWLKESSAP